MGGTLGAIFKGSQALTPISSTTNIPLFGAATAAAGPSAGSKMLASGLKGALSNFAQPAQPNNGATIPGPGPSPIPVDASFFQPSNYGPMMPPTRALYGGQ